MKRHHWIAASSFLIIALLATQGRAELTGYTTKRVDGQTILTSLTATRGAGTVVFDAGKLISARVVHFKSDQQGVLVVPSGMPVPKSGRRCDLLDIVLNAGLINPGQADKPLEAAPVLSGPAATPGLGVHFAKPVVNLPGDDVVLFELQRRQASPLAGDPVHVSPLTWRDGLRSITITSFDITFDHAKAQDLDAFSSVRLAKPPQSLSDLESSVASASGAPTGFKALGVAIDLSKLGYRDGERVDGLFFQDAAPGAAAVDPICIVGLPLPEPPNVLDKEPPSSIVVQPKILARMLDGPLSGIDEIIFAEREPGTDHWYANFGWYSSPAREYPPQRAPDGVKLPRIYKAGGRLCLLNLRTRKVTVLLDDRQGSVRDPHVHYDGEKILFSYRRADQPYFHLYEIGVDGTGLTQLTDGPYNDIEPVYLPDGGIMFCSDRCNRYVNCWITPVATLYRCNADGSGLRMISTNIEHDNTPWMLPDGRIAYMRWEYVDRSQSHFHHLWTTNPDGTAQMVLYGNQHPGYAMLDAKPIPGTSRLIASFSPGHGRPEHAGYVTDVDLATGPDDLSAARRISRGGPSFRDPYAISEDCFLVATGREIRVMDGRGRTEAIYEVPTSAKGVIPHEPRPLRARSREPIIPSRVDLSQKTGRLILADVYEGRNMDGVKRGEIASLLVLEQLPKPVSFSGGMWPISAGGTFTLARVLGTVPVEQDGSAYMEVPAMRSLFFVALDKRNRSVKRMHSFLSVQPGEVTGCVGCHERRLIPPATSMTELAAFRRKPDTIRPIPDVPDVLDFARDIQPILDKHCVRCHNPDRFEGHVDLCGDHTPLFCQSYWTLLRYGLIADGRNEHYGNRPPRTTGSAASPLLDLLAGGHHDVKASELEIKTVRLWIDSSAPYAGTYAALGSGMCPVEFPIETIVRRCGSCHAEKPKTRPLGKHPYFSFGKPGPAVPLVHTFLDLQQIRARIGYYKMGNTRPPQSLCNLSRPTKSILLRAPLAKRAGGLSLCKGEVFATTDDADYRTMLRAIQAASDKLAREKRFDMPGFRPNDYYLYQMQRYGILLKDLKATDPVDPYETDRAYWKSSWYEPEGRSRPR